MRIAIFSEVFLPKIDGVVTRLVRTVEQLKALDQEVVIFSPGTDLDEFCGYPVVRVRSTRLRPWYPEIHIGLPTPRIARTLEEFTPDVVHAVNPVALAAYGVLSGKRRNIPLLASFHTDLPKYTEAMDLGFLQNFAKSYISGLHNLADMNLCTSPQMVEAARAIGIRRVRLWPKAVDTVMYHPDKRNAQMRARLTDGHPEQPLVVYVGRIAVEKKLDVLRSALERMPGVRLAVVGSGPARDQLEKDFAGTPTVFTGYMSGDELAAAYASADVFAFPSTTETLGLVALESMASGVPVVGARAGGIPDVIADGENGFLFTPGDHVELADQVMLLLSDVDLRRRFSAAGRAETEKWGWRAATERLLDYYQHAQEVHWRAWRNRQYTT
ncbi:glycosyltransferase [Raineyella fluvialis]|uniref:Glycosyltransferase n=1 Tax=Raineyella fluvialis TaxID=2662261 RepID=A0A5Q2FFL7_9ACTN|nr:glycosyltransferase [Raineyella fluvialis]QGF23913.1 glycosyltransferase [Raineyella fluvialis]